MKHLYSRCLSLCILAFLFINKIDGQTYCGISFPSGVAPITEVQFGMNVNTSVATSTSDYEDFTNLLDTVYSGTNTMLLVKGTTGGNYSDSVMAYFDWNQNGSFNDTGEAYFIGVITNSAGINTTESVIKNIVLGNNLGNVRMRITKKRNGAAGACNNSGIGQAEDYNIYVHQGYPCSGVPYVSTAIAPSSICPNEPFALSVSNYTIANNIYFTWQKYNHLYGLWDDISGANTPTYIVSGITTTEFYRAYLSCPNAGAPEISNFDTVNTSGLTSFSNNSPVCQGDTIHIALNTCNGCTIAINGPNNFTASGSFDIPSMSTTDTGWYYYTVNLGSCSSSDSFYVSLGNCADSVWPGDVNNDLITNNLDALYLAQSFGYTGSSRVNASINYTAQACADWSSTMANNVNRKFADCDGNGIVNFADSSAIVANYGLPHLKETHRPKAKTTGNPDLYFDNTGLNFVPNHTVNIPIMLGTATNNMNNIFGLAGQIKLDNITLTQPLFLDHQNINSWFGNYNTWTFRKQVNNNQLDFTYVKTNHLNSSGYGEIGYVTIKIPTNVSGYGVLYFDHMTMIDSSGAEITAYNVLDDTIHITPLNISQLQTIEEAQIVPNPSNGMTKIIFHTNNAEKISINVTDIYGKEVWTNRLELNAGEQSILLPANSLNAGIYYITIGSIENPKEKTLKWIKL